MIAGSRSVRSCRAIGQDAVFISRKIGAVERSQGTRVDCPISRRTRASKAAVATMVIHPLRGLASFPPVRLSDRPMDRGCVSPASSRGIGPQGQGAGQHDEHQLTDREPEEIHGLGPLGFRPNNSSSSPKPRPLIHHVRANVTTKDIASSRMSSDAIGQVIRSASAAGNVVLSNPA
jgi:hypothetical protein